MPHLARPFILAAIAAVALAGCGSSSKSSSGSSGAPSNGVAAKSPDQIIAAARSAADAAKSVHVSGSVASGGQTIALDLSLSAGTGGSGTFSENGLSVQLIALQNTIYLKGTPAFWQKFGGAAASKLLAGRWLKAPATSGSFAGIAQLADFHKLVDSTISTHGAVTKGSTTTIAGQPAIGVVDTTDKGILYVATTGTPYPLQIAKAGSSTNSGKLTFDQWNAPVTVTAPTDVVDLSQLKGFS